MKNLLAALAILALFVASPISGQVFQSEEDYVRSLFKKYGKDKIVGVIQSERNGFITLIVSNELRDFSGRPNSDFITPHTICVDLKKIGWDVLELSDKLKDIKRLAKLEAERREEAERKREEFARQQRAKGLVNFKGRWVTPKEKRELEYEHKASELTQMKSQKNVPYIVLKSTDYGALCIMGMKDPLNSEISFSNGEIFCLLGVTTDLLADGEKMVSDLYWAGTDTIIIEDDEKRTLNCYSYDKEIAKKAVRIKFGLYDEEQADTPGIITDEKQEPVKVADATPAGFGSGFIITENGYIVTNYHVIKGAKKVCIRTYDTTLDAKIIEFDQDTDLALLKIEGSFEPVTFSPDRTSSLGQTIFTIGFPMPNLQGFSPKVTKGVISALKGIKDDIRTYQIDASVQPGNSGGPLADESGNIVGVVVARLSDAYVVQNTGSVPQNVNYAVKKSYLMAFLNTHEEIAKEIEQRQANENIPFADAVEKLRKSTVLVAIY